MGINVNISHYSRNVLAGIKEQRGHKSFDSALKEVFMRADLNEEELIEIAKEHNVYKDKDGNTDTEPDTSMEELWGDDE